MRLNETEASADMRYVLRPRMIIFNLVMYKLRLYIIFGSQPSLWFSSLINNFLMKFKNTRLYSSRVNCFAEESKRNVYIGRKILFVLGIKKLFKLINGNYNNQYNYYRDIKKY